MNSLAIVIPARMGSTRFPGKPLVDLCGKPMIQWVYERSVAAGVTDQVLVATPDAEIVEACKGFGAPAILTKMSHPTGTDRIAEVAESVVADVYINVQGDEPLIDMSTVRAIAEPFSDASVMMASVYAECPPSEEENPAVVKVVTDLRGNALYFSRHAIPFPRNARVGPLKKHIGIYAYRRSVLMEYPSWTQTPLEISESLEQLRFLENGVGIRMVEGRGSVVSVDTPEQADEVRKYLATAHPV
ncbi:MAG: 3-deoxy-manno-octulosonate cytidylyltransferase [Armatimonadetes bacterium]|nr:3-deoxy-manno-octulosonate cytidylyltransferase [Armatimonadota bacterium]